MSNPKFYIGNLAGTSYTTSEGSEAGYPVTNLQNYDPDRLWKSGNDGYNQKLLIDLGAARVVNFFIAINHNFKSMLSARLEYDDADNPAFPNPVLAAADLWDVPTDESIYLLEQVTKRYWRINMPDPDGNTPQLGLVFLESVFDFGMYSYPWSENDEAFETSEGIALSGKKRTAQSILGRLIHSIEFKISTATVRTDFQRFFQKVRGKGCPFYYVNPDGEMSYMKLVVDKAPVQGVNPLIYNVVRLDMESVNVNQIPL